jgi:hypothetical protein
MMIWGSSEEGERRMYEGRHRVMRHCPILLLCGLDFRNATGYASIDLHWK